ncbi:MAG: threonylcarbamoyl-AMP synthase [Clostridia bacterium]|nr:threonylcarbamoyl-AMP synthase [Clostridia bacterium]
MITNNVKLVANELKSGNVIAFRTDTIYGLSSTIYDDNAVAKIFELKKRNDGKPLIVLVPKNFDITSLVEINENAKKLIDAFWPGPLTIIFKLKSQVAKGITPFDTLSLRMPNDDTCQKLLESVGEPITSTSCNISGEQILNNPKDIDRTFNIMVLDGGVAFGGMPSTIVNVAVNPVQILRIGAISEQEIINVLEKNTYF